MKKCNEEFDYYVISLAYLLLFFALRYNRESQGSAIWCELIPVCVQNRRKKRRKKRKEGENVSVIA